MAIPKEAMLDIQAVLPLDERERVARRLAHALRKAIPLINDKQRQRYYRDAQHIEVTLPLQLYERYTQTNEPYYIISNIGLHYQFQVPLVKKPVDEMTADDNMRTIERTTDLVLFERSLLAAPETMDAVQAFHILADTDIHELCNTWLRFFDYKDRMIKVYPYQVNQKTADFQ